ncbi:MAG: hypothetical protein QXO37_09280 [Candidatus Nitrosocaldaceae archaeon]
MRNSLLIISAAVLLLVVLLQQQQQQEAYASHSYCNTQSYNTMDSSYYREECYYYDYQERLIKYTLYENSKYWGSGYSESTTRITETLSYYDNGNLRNHCYEYSYTNRYNYSGGNGNGSIYQRNCEGYDQQGRLVEKVKVDEQIQHGCATYCYDREKKDNRTDYYYYDSNGLLFQHCYNIDKREYSSASSTSDNQYYLTQCDRRSSWIEVHEGESIEVKAWLTNGYERTYYYYSGRTGNERDLWIKSWYDTQTKRIYTYLLHDWSYSYSGCCSGYGTVESLNPPPSHYSYDSLCYPYAVVKQNYLIENGKPTGNEDGTFYRSDKFEYRVKGIYLLRNDPQNPCYIESIEPSPNNSQYLSIEQCYEYFAENASICKRGKVSIASNTPYGEHNLYAKATYKQPWFRYWTKYYYCWSNAGGQGCNNEAPKVESGYYTNYYDIKLATAYVVQYNPQFRVYPYLSISDPNTWSYEKQVMLAIHYLGNKDQSGNINTAQRALINKLIDKEYAYEVLKGYGLPIVDPSAVQKYLNLNMKFRVANDPSSYDCLSSSYIAIDSNNDSYTDELLLLQEGYYAISLHYIGEDMQDIMLDLINNQLADSTLQQEYYTARYTIAGEDTTVDKQLFDFTYVYPARSFYATVVVKSVKENANGGLEPLPVYRMKITFEDYQGSLPLLGYLYAKYQQDIWKRYEEEDQQLAYLPLCLENAQQAYRQTEYEYYNTAQGVAWVRFTSLLIGEKARQALEVNDLLDIPIQYALQATTPYTVKIEIQPYPNSMIKQNTYMLPAFQQYQQYVYYANNGFYIWNDRYVHRYGDKLLVEPARYFRIAELYISNDQGVQQVDPNLCRIGCTLYAGYGSVNLVARDEWFGTALAGYPAITIEPPIQEDPYIGWTMLAVTALVSFFLIAYLKYMRRQVNRI